MNRQAQDSKVLVRVIKGLLEKQQSLTVHFTSILDSIMR